MSATSYSQIPRSKMVRRIALLVVSVSALVVLTGGLHSTTGSQSSTLGAAKVQLKNVIDSSSQFLFNSEASEDEEGAHLLCPTCDCSRVGSYAASPYIARVAEFPLPSSERSVRQRFWSHPTEAARYVLHKVILDSQLKPVLYNDKASLSMTKRFLTCPDQILAANLGPLKFGLPTAYVYTRTGPAGRLSRIGARAKYMQRHVETLKAYNRLVKREGYLDGTRGDSKQLVWLVLEDEDKLDQGILATLQQSGLPFVYLAHGPTRRYGGAQWNQALKLIERLRDDFLGDGPIYNLDDDSYVLPMLFKRLWQVKKLIGWQVGNFPVPKFNSTWEGPFFENGNMTRWHAGGMINRIFPIDMNGFAINSSVVGPGREVHGPQYVPFDTMTGETEFCEKIYKVRQQMEPLCWDTVKDQCYFVWHNGWMEDELDESVAELHAMYPPDYQ